MSFYRPVWEPDSQQDRAIIGEYYPAPVSVPLFAQPWLIVTLSQHSARYEGNLWIITDPTNTKHLHNGPTSKTLGRRCINVMRMFCVCWREEEIMLGTVIWTYRPLGYEKVYLPLYKVTDTPFHIQGLIWQTWATLANTRHSHIVGWVLEKGRRL